MELLYWIGIGCSAIGVLGGITALTMMWLWRDDLYSIPLDT